MTVFRRCQRSLFVTVPFLIVCILSGPPVGAASTKKKQLPVASYKYVNIRTICIDPALKCTAVRILSDNSGVIYARFRRNQSIESQPIDYQFFDFRSSASSTVPAPFDRSPAGNRRYESRFLAPVEADNDYAVKSDEFLLDDDGTEISLPGGGSAHWALSGGTKSQTTFLPDGTFVTVRRLPGLLNESGSYELYVLRPDSKVPNKVVFPVSFEDKFIHRLSTSSDGKRMAVVVSDNTRNSARSQAFLIDGTSLEVAELPTLPGFPYVNQVIIGNEKVAIQASKSWNKRAPNQEKLTVFDTNSRKTQDLTSRIPSPRPGYGNGPAFIVSLFGFLDDRTLMYVSSDRQDMGANIISVKEPVGKPSKLIGSPTFDNRLSPGRTVVFDGRGAPGRDGSWSLFAADVELE